MYRSTFTIVAAVAVILAASAPVGAQEKIRVAELSPEAEQAINRGLAFMVKTQNKDGTWGEKNQVAITSLALMSFMVKGHFPEKEPYGAPMAKGLDFLLKEARLNKGYMGTQMYEHGLATLALSEVWGETTRGPEVRDALKSAVQVILRNQTEAGGWGYYPDRGLGYQDMSITVMQLVALSSAKEAGIYVPDATIKKAVAYVKSTQNPRDGTFGYQRAGDYISPLVKPFARTAAGATCLVMTGERKSEECKKAIQYLHSLDAAPFDPRYTWFYYGHYYAVQAMYQSSEQDYLKWYPRIRDSLVKAQHEDGGWTGGIPDRVNTKIATDRDSYCTPVAILVLGVPYRFLPIYQR